MDIDDSRYDIYELDNGELYVVEKLTGDIYEINLNSDQEEYEEEYKKTISTNIIDTIKELKEDYKNIQMGAETLKYDLNNLAKKHGIQIRKKTRKDSVDEWREKKNQERNLTEDLTSKEYKKKTIEIDKKTTKFMNNLTIKPESRRKPDILWSLAEELDNERVEHFEEVEKTLAEYEGNTPLKLKTKPKYFLEC